MQLLYYKCYPLSTPISFPLRHSIFLYIKWANCSEPSSLCVLPTNNYVLLLKQVDSVSRFPANGTCASIEDSDQPAHPRSLIRLLIISLWVAKGLTFLQEEYLSDF